LEYHPQAKREFEGAELGSSYRSGEGDQFGAQFAAAQIQEDMAAGSKSAIARKSQSLPREKMNAYVKNAEEEYGERVNARQQSKCTERKLIQSHLAKVDRTVRLQSKTIFLLKRRSYPLQLLQHIQ
jgi:hypothetical protein